jgi:hypothetical protein
MRRFYRSGNVVAIASSKISKVTGLTGRTQAKARSRRKVWRNEQLIKLRAVWIGGVMEADFPRRAAQKIFGEKIPFFGNVPLGFSGALRRGRFFSGVQFAVGFAASRGIGQGCVRRVQFLRGFDGGGRVWIRIGMILFGEQPVGRADLREGAAAVAAERGMMIFFSGLQFPGLLREGSGVSLIVR